MPSLKQVLVGVLGIGLPLTGLSLLAAPAQANPAGTGLVISEVYGGGGNSGSTWKSDFVELYNPTDAAIPVGGWTLQARSATNTSAATASNSVALTGEVPAGGHYLIKLADGTGGTQDLPVPDATGSIAMGAAGWQVWLSNGSALLDPVDGNVVGTDPAIIDFVGAATNSSSYEGAPANEAPSATVSAQRAATGTDTDNNAADFNTAAPTPQNDGINPPLEATDPADIKAYVGIAIDPLAMKAVGGAAPYTWAVTAGTLPDGLTLSASGQLAGTPTTAGTANVTFTVTDSATPAATDSVDLTITVLPEPEELTIAQIQGTDTETSPQVGNVVRTQGVVTAMYKDPAFTNSNIDGMFVQTAGTGGATDATAGASDAVFVWWGNNVGAVDGIAIGDSVEVTGEVSEFNGTTQIAVGAGDVVELGTPLSAVTPLAIAYPTTNAGREAQEGMLLAPTDTFTVSNVFNTNRFGEVGLATGESPLVQPTDVADDDDAAALQVVKDDNFARGVILDDGTSVDYMNTAAAKAQPLPWLTAAGSGPNPIRIGAAATLNDPVILEFEFGAWRFYPQSPVFGNGDSVATFQDTRPANMAPADVAGEIKLATFNVLNYFNTTGEQYVADGAGLTRKTHCTYFTDRAGNRIANNRCGLENPPGSSEPNDGSGPRGAANELNLNRQQQKIVTAINALDADIVTLEELENSIKLPGDADKNDRDNAIKALVAALNAAAPGTWDYVPSPAEALGATNVAEQDTIRNGFIYKPASVELVGPSDMLFGTTAFANAREPLAQAFKPVGAGDEMTFAVIVNHFKSKGDSTPPATGDNANNPDTGAFNGDRVRQAQALVAFAEDFAAARRTDKVFLTGDFNAYDREDPVSEIEQAGYELVQSDDPSDESYSFSGLSGSLDHVFASEAAMATVQGADIWEINADESVAFQYSRHNYNVTDFWQPNLPFASSDHNPEIVGFDPAPSAPLPKQVQVLGINDFHGRLLADGNNAAGAAVLSGVVKDLETQNPNTVFAAAGDLIGASTFESFILNDKPTIDVLNEAGLDVSAVGNHELDQGYDDLVNRVMADYDPETNPEGGAEWQYIAANLEMKATGDPAVPATFKTTVDGVEIGFVGAVTEELPSLVSPGGIADIAVTDIVTATNEHADLLKAEGVDIVLLLVHEGAPNTNCATMDDNPDSTFGSIVTGVNANVDAVISGHTHLAYNCKFPVQEWIDEGRDVTERPVVSAGQYGTNLNQLLFDVDPATGELVGIDQNLLPLPGRAPADPATKAIVDQAVADAEPLGAVKLGEIEGIFGRAKLPVAAAPPAPPLAAENRGGESTLGNLVAEVQQWATEESHGAQIAFMNPGGLRADMEGVVNGDVRDLTYKQAANVQPFANTLVNMDLTGAQIETVLEQQWQRTSAGAVPSRPFLRLGVSEGFTYTYVETPVTVGGTNTFQGEVTGMWLDGEPIDPAATYSVTVNSFLSTGGDNFFELANGANKADTGKIDLQAMVDYMAAFAGDAPLPVDYAQRAVEVEFPAAAPAAYAPGDTVAFDVASLAMSGRVNPTDPVYDLQDTQIQVRLGDQVLGTATVDNTIGTAVYDAYGKASVSFTLPTSTPAGATELTLVGPTTGTLVRVPITVELSTFENSAPPAITGDAVVGKTLTATAGTWSPEPTSTAYQWFADGVAIDGADEPTYVLSEAERGKAITVEVTVSAPGYADASEASAPTDPVLGVFQVDTAPAVTGTPKVGETLTGTAGEYTPDGTTSLQWLADDEPIDGATGPTYEIQPGDLDAVISLLVTVSAEGYETLEVESNALAAVEKGDFTAPEPTIAGQAKVGKTLTADEGTWEPRPESLEYAWLADGVPIIGATGTTLKLKPAQAGKQITFQVTGSLDGYVTKTVTSDPTAKVVKGSVKVSSSVSPARIEAKSTRAAVTVRVTNADGVVPTGTVTITAKGIDKVSKRLTRGAATLRLGVFKTTGRKTLVIKYSGDAGLLAATVRKVVTVRR